MTLTEEQYERIACWLDGESVELSGDERAAAEDIRLTEARLAGPMLDVKVPAQAMARARRRLTAATAARPVRRARFAARAVAAAAVAAAIIIALATLLNGPDETGRQKNGAGVAQDVKVWVDSMEQAPGGEDIEMLAGELDELEAELAVSRLSALDRRIESVQQEIDDFWLDEPLTWTPEG